MSVPAKPLSLRTRSPSKPQTFAPGALAPVISIRDLKVHCSACTLRELCLPMGLGADDLKHIDALLGMRIKLRKGETLYRVGESFTEQQARDMAERCGFELRYQYGVGDQYYWLWYFKR